MRKQKCVYKKLVPVVEGTYNRRQKKPRGEISIGKKEQIERSCERPKNCFFTEEKTFSRELEEKIHTTACGKTMGRQVLINTFPKYMRQLYKSKERSCLMANHTIYDDVFRTMLEKMPQLAVPLINEVFGTDYPSDVEIIQKRNEYQTKNGEIITDSHLKIKNKGYHIECQSTWDSTMEIRMVEYDFAIGLGNIRKEHGIYRLYFPSSCVLYLRGKSDKDHLVVELVMPDGRRIEYRVPVVYVEEYPREEIFQKYLFFLLPYYSMRYERKRKELGKDPEKLRDFLEEYREIERYLEKEFLEKDQEIMFRDIVELISRIGNHILRDEEQVKERFGEVMGGKVLELESDKLIKQGIEQGMERERKNTEKALQKVKEAEEEIRRLKQLLQEKGAGHTEQ